MLMDKIHLSSINITKSLKLTNYAMPNDTLDEIRASPVVFSKVSPNRAGSNVWGMLFLRAAFGGGWCPVPSPKTTLNINLNNSHLKEIVLRSKYWTRPYNLMCSAIGNHTIKSSVYNITIVQWAGIFSGHSVFSWKINNKLLVNNIYIVQRV
jgi:hypothetical protein